VGNKRGKLWWTLLGGKNWAKNNKIQRRKKGGVWGTEPNAKGLNGEKDKGARRNCARMGGDRRLEEFKFLEGRKNKKKKPSSVLQ